ncbi:transposase (plasmid) [Deinococcus aetherius]|uniref:Transposase n=1 Tax=Deinococcus aetherius TaxID=200252 RepID=A0ABM8AHS0_9DEIO|nr:hypothetical protein [Deinococcus aetherius]BDP43358.1 transposase [Deinococcus aetherius]
MTTTNEYKPGRTVYLGDEPYVLVSVLDFEHVHARHPNTGVLRVLKRVDIMFRPPQTPPPQLQHESMFTDAQWAEMQRKRDAVAPILAHPKNTAARHGAIRALSKELNVSHVTIYEWVRNFEEAGMPGLARKVRSDRGSRRIKRQNGERLDASAQAAFDTLLNDLIKTHYTDHPLTSKKTAIARIQAGLKAEGWADAPYQTVWKWLDAARQKEPEAFAAKELGEEAAENRYADKQGTVPVGEHPLDLMDIDHVYLDLELVVGQKRLPVGRVWITLLLDTRTRMVWGFYVSFDPPSVQSLAMCLRHAVLPKEAWLRELGIEGVEWPSWGFFKRIRHDHGREFYSKSFDRFLDKYSIERVPRPPSRPRWGAYIERFAGTLNRELHEVRGTTFHNVATRKAHRPRHEGRRDAVFVIRELEKWLAVLIGQVYHNRPHKGLGMSPLERFRRDVFGEGGQPGMGLPAQIDDPWTFAIDALPTEERGVQDGSVVTLNYLKYHAPWLRDFLGKKEPLAFKVNRHDIRTLYFFHPQWKKYVPLPCKLPDLPPITIWDMNEAKRIARAKFGNDLDQEKVVAGYYLMRSLEEQEYEKSVAARRAGARRDEATRHTEELNNLAPPESGAEQESADSTMLGWLDEGDIEAYAERPMSDRDR